MADNAAQTNPASPGITTSEGKLATLSVIVSVLAMIVPTALTLLTDMQAKFPTWGWTGPAIGIIGLLSAALTAFGYGAQRRDVKVALINAAAGKPG